MSDSRKRRGSAALPSYMRYARPRHNPADLGSLVEAIAAAVVLAAAFATGVAHTLQAPKVRATIDWARRLDWEEHMDDLENRKAFLHYYRMPEETFDKLVQFLALHLEKYARACSVHNCSCHRNCCTTIMINVMFAVTILL